MLSLRVDVDEDETVWKFFFLKLCLTTQIKADVAVVVAATVVAAPVAVVAAAVVVSDVAAVAIAADVVAVLLINNHF